nr:hypothetical protein [Tanacetum cinerariifolium]
MSPEKYLMETSATREYPSLIHTIFLTHTVGGVFLNPEDKALYDEMLRLHGLGSNNPTGVPYTKDEIMAIVREGKQQGHIPGVRRVLPGQGSVIPPSSQSMHSIDIARLKKSEKGLTKQVNMFIRLFRSDDKFSQLLSQLESQPEYGGGSRSGGCEDDEPGDDEDGDEDKVVMYLGRFYIGLYSSMEGLNAILENGLWFIRNHLLILKKWSPDENLSKEDGRSSYARVMIELRADVELKDNIVVAMPKIIKEGHYICNLHVEYEWKPPRCASCKVFSYIHEECTKNTGAGEKKTLRKPSQTSRGVPFGLKIGFKPQKEYRPVPKKSIASSSGTNGGTTNLVNNEATSSGSSFINVDNNSTSTIPIIDKIWKFEELITSGQAILVDEAGNPLKKDLPQELQAICDNLDIQVQGRKKK